MIVYKIHGWALTGPRGQTSPVMQNSADVWRYFFGREATTEEIRKHEEDGFRVLPCIWPTDC
jgi:hypothetical protein